MAMCGAVMLKKPLGLDPKIGLFHFPKSLLRVCPLLVHWRL